MAVAMQQGEAVADGTGGDAGVGQGKTCRCPAPQVEGEGYDRLVNGVQVPQLCSVCGPCLSCMLFPETLRSEEDRQFEERQ